MKRADIPPEGIPFQFTVEGRIVADRMYLVQHAGSVESGFLKGSSLVTSVSNGAPMALVTYKDEHLGYAVPEAFWITMLDAVDRALATAEDGVQDAS